MAKISAWLITLIGLVLVLAALDVSLGAALDKWLIPLAVLIIGVTKLLRSYKMAKI